MSDSYEEIQGKLNEALEQTEMHTGFFSSVLLGVTEVWESFKRVFVVEGDSVEDVVVQEYQEPQPETLDETPATPSS